MVRKETTYKQENFLLGCRESNCDTLNSVRNLSSVAKPAKHRNLTSSFLSSESSTNFKNFS